MPRPAGAESTWNLPGAGDTWGNAATISGISMPRASATSAAKSAFSTLTAPVNGVPTRWPRQVNQVRPGANTTSLASLRCTGTIGMRPWRSNR